MILLNFVNQNNFLKYIPDNESWKWNPRDAIKRGLKFSTMQYNVSASMIDYFFVSKGKCRITSLYVKFTQKKIYPKKKLPFMSNWVTRSNYEWIEKGVGIQMKSGNFNQKWY